MQSIETFFAQYDFGVPTEIVIALTIIIASVIIARVTFYTIERWFTKLAARTKTRIDDKILEALRKPIYYIIILIGVQLALGYLLVSYAPYDGYVSDFITIVLILIATYLITRIITIIIEDIGTRISAKTESTLDDEALPFVVKLINIAIYLFAFSMILDIIGIDPTPLIAGLGIIGFALGFGAKDVVANILAGFFILLDRPFIRGERIEVSGNSGDVVDIGLRTTKIKTSTNEIIIIPNSDIVSSPVKNYALPEMMVKLIADFGVAYGSDIELVKKIILGVAKESESVLDSPEPTVYFIEFGESSLNFKLVCWMPDFRSFGVKDEINTKISKRFDEAGIEIPFPTRTVYLQKL